MNYALIGCGRVAINHIRAALANGLTLAAVCDISDEHICDLFSRAGFTESQAAAVHRYADYTEMLAKEPLTLVSIALPSGLHAECAAAVIESGVNVIIEKPIALSLADADRLIALSREKNVKVCACHQNRFNLAVQEMRRRLENGSFGTLSNAAVTVRWSRDERYYGAGDWRGTWAQDGGALMNQSIHGIDLLRWMCGGKPKTVYGITKRQYHPYIQAEDVGAAVLEFENGVIATAEGGVNVYGDDLEEHLTLIGSKGVMKLGGKNASTVEYSCFADADAADEKTIEETAPNVYGNGHVSLFRDMKEAIEQNRPPYVTAEDGRDALETVLAVYLSCKTGKPVTLPLQNVSTLDFTGLFDA